MTAPLARRQQSDTSIPHRDGAADPFGDQGLRSRAGCRPVDRRWHEDPDPSHPDSGSPASGASIDHEGPRSTCGARPPPHLAQGASLRGIGSCPPSRIASARTRAPASHPRCASISVSRTGTLAVRSGLRRLVAGAVEIPSDPVFLSLEPLGRGLRDPLKGLRIYEGSESIKELSSELLAFVGCSP